MPHVKIKAQAEAKRKIHRSIMTYLGLYRVVCNATLFPVMLALTPLKRGLNTMCSFTNSVKQVLIRERIIRNCFCPVHPKMTVLDQFLQPDSSSLTGDVEKTLNIQILNSFLL